MTDITEDDAISYLLEDLDELAAARVDAAVSEGGANAEQVEGFRAAFEAYALADSPVAEPSDDLLARVLAEVGEVEDAAESAPAEAAPFPILPWAVAACFAVSAGAGIMGVSAQRDRLAEENALLRAQVEKSDLRVRELASQVDESFKAFIVWDEVRGAGVLKVDNLPALGEGGDYQLWVVSEGYDNPLDGGVFDTEDGKAEIQIVTREMAKEPVRADKVTLFAISRERAGGVPVSETKDFVLTATY